MIRLTRMTDYSIVLMTYCARHMDRPIHTTRDLATEARLPLPTVGKILKLLARNGLMQSHRGVKGGYALARRPDQITVAEIIVALEGPIAITDCSNEQNHPCEIEGYCPVGGNWQLINETVRRALGELTLAEIAKPLGKNLIPVSGQSADSIAPKVPGHTGYTS